MSVGQDLRYALRQWRRSPGFAVTAILTLALGIGANTAIFLLTYSILLKGLPVAHPEQLVRYQFRSGDSEIGLSFAQYQALEDHQGATNGMFAWASDDALLRHGEDAERVPIAMATGTMFDVLQLQPTIGRAFARQLGERGGAYEPEALITYDFWRSAYHQDPKVLGQTLNLDRQSVTIVGVLPPGFDGILPEHPVRVVVPLSFEAVLHPDHPMLKSTGAFWLTVMGRLKPGVKLQAAQANLAAIYGQIQDEADPSGKFLNGGFFAAYKLGVESGRGGQSFLRAQYTKPLLALEGLCGLMLLLCAVNVALVVLARVSGRLHEFAVRNAMGASRGRLLAQVVTETLLLGAGGLAVGCWLGWELAHALVGMISQPGAALPALELKAGFTVFAFAAATSLFAACVAGLWPAWKASRTAPAVDLKQTGARSTRRVGMWMIPAQVMLGVLLLNAALLLTGTLRNYLKEHSGFNAEDVAMAALNPPDSGMTPEQQHARSLELLRQLEATPGVKSAALMMVAPLSNSFSSGDYYSHDAQGAMHLNRQLWAQGVSQDYFATMGTRILEGRAFTPADVAGDRVCILSAEAAQFYFPTRGAVGSMLNSGDGTEAVSERESCRVIGVAEDARYKSLLAPSPAMGYFLFEQRKAENLTLATVAVKGANPTLAMDALRRVVTRVYGGVAPQRVYLFQDAVNYNLSRQRLLGSVSGGFALLALALLATGLYGILMRLVAEQKKEIGIRMALGARREQIVSGLLRNAGVRIAAGVVAGGALAFAGERLLRPLLFGVKFQSPPILLATGGVLIAVLVLAFLVPARRAASVDPAQAIREE